METNNKLREAVKCLMDNLNIHLMQPSELITVNRAELDGMVMVCEKALAAPPRNCDVYNNESCRMAYHLHGDGLMTMQAFADWLYAPATEKEGGASR